MAAGDLRIEWRVRYVRLWQVSARQTLGWQRPSLLPFVPLMRGGRTELETGAHRLAEVTEEGQRRELSLHFLLLGGLRYNQADLLVERLKSNST